MTFLYHTGGHKVNSELFSGIGAIYLDHRAVWRQTKGLTNNSITQMTASQSEELLAIGWFILATQLSGWMRYTCVSFGVIALVISFAYAVLK